MLEIKDIVFSVPDPDAPEKEARKSIIDRVTYTFEQGRLYAITGLNGS